MADFALATEIFAGQSFPTWGLGDHPAGFIRGQVTHHRAWVKGEKMLSGPFWPLKMKVKAQSTGWFHKKGLPNSSLLVEGFGCDPRFFCTTCCTRTQEYEVLVRPRKSAW